MLCTSAAAFASPLLPQMGWRILRLVRSLERLRRDRRVVWQSKSNTFKEQDQQDTFVSEALDERPQVENTHVDELSCSEHLHTSCL